MCGIYYDYFICKLMKSLYDIPENQATLNSNGSTLCL